MTTVSTPFEQATVADAMHAGIVTVPADATPAEIARALAESRIHCVVVAAISRRGTSEHLTWGVVSDLDLVGALASGATASAAMLAATDAITIESGEALEDAARIMSEHDVTHLVVVDPGSDEPIGVLSTLDIARVAAR